MNRIEELYNAHKNSVYRFALSYTGNIADAEDITQTVFLKLIPHVSKIPVGKEAQWLFKVTHNACIDLFRTKSYFATDPLPEIAFEDTRQTALFEAIQALNKEYRVVIYLFYFEGYSTKEIGKILGVRQTCVTTRLQRARTMLKMEMEEVCANEP